MKTEPIEALEEIKHCSWETGNFKISSGFESYEVVDEDDAINIANIAFREGQSSPKIKQLEWREEKGDGEYWEAITPIGTYSITFDFGVYVALYDMDNDVDGEWKSLAKAKIACNNDFERRVMECLDLKAHQNKPYRHDARG